MNELLSLAKEHVEFLRKCAANDASEAGAQTTLLEAAKWEVAILKAESKQGQPLIR